MNRYFFECFVEQIYHFEALDNKLLKKLKPGKDVVFATLSDDKNDDDKDKDKEDKSGTYKNQVLVKFENKKLGVLSVEDSNKMLPFLHEGWGAELFSGKICSVYDKDDENKRIKIVVYINNKASVQK